MLTNVFYFIACVLYLLNFAQLEEGSCYADGNSVLCESSVKTDYLKTR